MMERFTDHPFAQTWWGRGVMSAVAQLHRSGLIEDCVERPYIVMMAAELKLWRVGLGEEHDKFVDELHEDENSDNLGRQLWSAIRAAVSLAQQTDGFNFEDMREDAIAEHAKRCSNPDCPVKKMVKIADEIAEDGLKLGN